MNEYYLISEIDVTNVQKNHRTILTINTLEVDGDIMMIHLKKLI